MTKKDKADISLNKTHWTSNRFPTDSKLTSETQFNLSHSTPIHAAWPQHVINITCTHTAQRCFFWRCVSKRKVSSVMLMSSDIASDSRLVKQQFVWLPGTIKRLSCPGSTTKLAQLQPSMSLHRVEHLFLSPGLCCTQRKKPGGEPVLYVVDRKSMACGVVWGVLETNWGRLRFCDLDMQMHYSGMNTLKCSG